MFLKPKVYLLLFGAGVFSLTLIWITFFSTSEKNLSWANSPSKAPLTDLLLQNRHGVKKTIYANDKGERLEWKIEAPKANLFLSRKDKSTFFFETLEEINLWQQESITIKPDIEQEIRFLKAKYATLNYSTLRLDAKDAFITTYKAKGTSINPLFFPETTLIKGLSKEASFFLENNHIIFEAKGFSAQLQKENNL